MWSTHLKSIGSRLVWGFGSMLALMLAIALIAGVSFHRVGTQVRQIVEVNNQRAAFAQDLLDNINLMVIQVRTIAFLTDLEAVKSELVTLEKARSAYVKSESALADALSQAHPDEQRLLQEIAAASAKGIPLLQLAAKQTLAGANIEATTTLIETLPPIEREWRAKVNELIALQSKGNNALAASVGAQTRSATILGASFVLLAVAVGVFVAWKIARSIQQPIGRAVRVAERIAEGDLDNNVERGGLDEVGRLLDAIGTMQDRLSHLVSQIRETAQCIQIASAEVAAGNLDFSQRTELSASKLQQTSNNMAQLTGNLRQAAEASEQANELSRRAAQIAKKGGSVVSQVVSTMQEIDGSSQKIADIIGVIDGIAFQTNILALNAAVEAARAGDLGRGFAVVAGEVRSLAQRSASAAKEIKGLIGASLAHVDAGSKLVGEAGGTMTEIVVSIQHVADIIGEVTVASREQSGRVDEVNGAVTQLDQTTQQNAALVEQGAAAAESLKDQAARLATLVSMFRLGSDRVEFAGQAKAALDAGGKDLIPAQEEHSEISAS